MIKKPFLYFLLFSFLAAFLFFCCTDSSDDDDNDDSDDDSEDLDDEGDNAGSIDDDDYTDDPECELTIHPPHLFNVYWNPNPVAWDDQANGWISNLLFEVCDIDINLNGGKMLFYKENSDELMLEATFSDWIDWDFQDYGDCGEPLLTGLPILFGNNSSKPDWSETICIDFQVTDATGLHSNKSMNICLDMP